jgi:hypothetical protein
VSLLAVWQRAPGAAGRWLGADPGGRPLDALLSGALVPVLVAALATAGAAVAAGVSALRAGTRRALAVAALAAALLDVALVHGRLVPSAPREWFTGVPAVVALARRDRAERLYAVDYLRRATGRTGPSWKPDESKELLARPRWEATALLSQDYPPDGSRWGLPGGYDLHVAQLDSPARFGLGTLVRFRQEDGPALARLLSLGGITHLAARHRAGLEAFGPAASLPTRHAGEVFLMRVPRPRPRVYVVEGARPAPGRALYDALLDPSFDPEREVLLGAGPAAEAHDGAVGEARLASWRPGHLQVAADLDRPGYLVVLEAFDPGWTARVDGRPVEPVPANGIFLGLALGVGRHSVELAYRPRGLAAGASLTVLALAAGALLLARARARETRPRPPGSCAR